MHLKTVSIPHTKLYHISPVDYFDDTFLFVFGHWQKFTESYATLIVKGITYPGSIHIIKIKSSSYLHFTFALACCFLV